MKGKIYCEQAYAQSKMLDCSGWARILPRKITPSDIDMVIANGRRILFTEFSSKTCMWDHLSTGQYRLYRDIVTNGNGYQFAALAQHEVPPDLQIDTTKDIKRFSFLVLKENETEPIALGPYDGIHWVDYVNKLLGF